MDNLFPVVIDDQQQLQINKETTEQKRKRLSGELRYITHQFNSKLLELLSTEVDVEIAHGEVVLFGDENLVGIVDVSFQPATRRY